MPNCLNSPWQQTTLQIIFVHICTITFKLFPWHNLQTIRMKPQPFIIKENLRKRAENCCLPKSYANFSLLALNETGIQLELSRGSRQIGNFNTSCPKKFYACLHGKIKPITFAYSIFRAKLGVHRQESPSYIQLSKLV